MAKSIRIYVIISSVFALVLSLSTALWGGTTGKIAGRVTDAETGEPLPGANVVIQGTTMGGATDSDGFYFVINVAPGTYTITATMMGYETVNKTDIIVSADRTVTIDCPLRPTVLIGQEVTVLAEREIVPMDISASQIIANAEEIDAVPAVTNILEYINLQAGVENDLIRGGGFAETQFMVDGLMVVDNRANKPIMMVNLSSIKEVNIIKGGFNAEYGNVRSGLINVITKDGSPDRYNASFDYRISPAHRKHFGASVYDANSYYLRPYVDPDVCYVGTKNGSWDEEMQQNYDSFSGWNEFSDRLLNDEDPSNDRTAEECRQLFMWRNTVEGCDSLGQVPRTYGDKPDWVMDASLSGPVPLIGRYLGNLTFFASYRNNWETYVAPTPPTNDHYKEETSSLKLVSQLSPFMKLKLEAMYVEINSLASGSGMDAWFRSGEANAGSLGSRTNAYRPFVPYPFDVWRYMVGVSLEHALSPNTFYTLRISNVGTSNLSDGPYKERDLTILRYFGATAVDEQPWGFTAAYGNFKGQNGANLNAHSGPMNRDWSTSSSINANFDLTSQVGIHNQVKMGVGVVYDDFRTGYAKVSITNPWDNWEILWDKQPYRVGAYIQDKLEFEGMIANVGLRLDYNEPNTDWYDVERYSKYFKKAYKDVFTELTPTEPAEGQMKISPRLGISHPISEDAKLYFNYGHFYSMPQSQYMYEINFGQPKQGVRSLGNPSAELPLTVQYELGLEYNIANLFLLHLAGYYKDAADQTGWVNYVNYDGSVAYRTIENNNYADTRGFELRIDKRWGRWITGWFNYNYMVITSGYIGRKVNYQDERQQAVYGLQNPYQEKPLARPIGRGCVIVTIPNDWGPAVAGIKPLSGIHMSLVGTWKAGSYMTWDPLETYQLQNNLQWKGRWNFDASFKKQMSIGRANLTLFADVTNVFNIKYLSTSGFRNTADRRRYYESLHLPMYKGAEYQAQGYTGGDDKLGDIKSDDKPYINMPNKKYCTFFNPRAFYFGIKFDI
ncbi:carboxypeptidase regulatory-like domain-containing protein [Candidatus Neomarinimicrobiota bacterium]